MGTGQILKEVFAKKVKEQVKILDKINCEELDTLWVKQILEDSIKYYYDDKRSI
jgi:hypothetical protein